MSQGFEANAAGILEKNAGCIAFRGGWDQKYFVTPL